MILGTVNIKEGHIAESLHCIKIILGLCCRKVIKVHFFKNKLEPHCRKWIAVHIAEIKSLIKAEILTEIRILTKIENFGNKMKIWQKSKFLKTFKFSLLIVLVVLTGYGVITWFCEFATAVTSEQIAFMQVF